MIQTFKIKQFIAFPKAGLNEVWNYKLEQDETEQIIISTKTIYKKLKNPKLKRWKAKNQQEITIKKKKNP